MLRRHLEHKTLGYHETLQDPHEPLKHIHFPNSGLVSLVIGTQDGRSVEVGAVGKEGIVGTAILAGVSASPLRAIVQIPGDACRMKAAALHALWKAAPVLQELLNRFAIFQSLQIAQTAACNRLHNVEQRLARWLLTTQDHATSRDLPITHDFLATMLGTDRPSVSLAAAELQKRGIIVYGRGAVKILNRKKLEAAACECYRIVQQLA